MFHLVGVSKDSAVASWISCSSLIDFYPKTCEDLNLAAENKCMD